MDFSKKLQAIFYIEATRAFFYPGAAGDLLQLPFPPDVVSDLEILNRPKLLEQLQAFLQTQSIMPSDILLVFATPIVFEKEFPQEKNHEPIDQFIEYIPFEEVLTRTFQQDKLSHVIGVNKEIYESFKDACEAVKCHVVAAVSYSSLVQIMPELAQNVDIPLILTKFDACKQFSLITPTTQQHMNQQTEQSTTTPQQVDKKRTYMLLGVFGVLMVVLIIVVISSMSHPTPKPVIRVLPPAPTAVVSPSVSGPTSSGSATTH